MVPLTLGTHQRSNQVTRAEHDHVGMMPQAIQCSQQCIYCAHGIKRLVPAQRLLPPGCQCLNLVHKYTDKSVLLFIEHGLDAVKHSAHEFSTFTEEFAPQGVGVYLNELALWELLPEAYCELLCESAAVCLISCCPSSVFLSYVTKDWSSQFLADPRGE